MYHIISQTPLQILTFDTQGISSHPNHYSLPFGASYLVHSLSLTGPITEITPRVFGLVTVPVVPKYLGIVSVLLARFKIFLGSSLSSLVPVGISQPMAVFTSGSKEYLTATRALREHSSQMLWFRYLYMLFSRYMWVNEWVEIIPTTLLSG